MVRSKRHNRLQPQRLPAVASIAGAPRTDAGLRILAALAVTYVVLLLIATAHPNARNWGLNPAGYLTLPFRALVILLTIAGTGLLVAASFRAGRTAEKSGVRERWERAFSEHRWLGWSLLIPYAAVLWALRTRSFLLGDQMVWMDSFRLDQHPLFSEPLAAATWYGFVAALRVIGLPITEPAVAALPVLCGVAAAILLWRIATLLAAPGRSRSVLFLLLMTLGSIELYCGYIESYPIVSVAILAFLWLGLRQTTSVENPVLFSISLAIAMASHLIAIFLVPAYLFAIYRRKIHPIRMAALAVLPFAVSALILLALGYKLGDLAGPFHVLGVAVEASGKGPASLSPGSVHLLRRGWDIANLLLLIMPAPLLLLMAGMVGSRTHTGLKGRDRAFLAIAAASGLLVAATLVLPGSPSQDWDLMSLTILPFAVLGASAVCGNEAILNSTLARRGLLTLALAPSFAFVMVGAIGDSGIGRFKALVGPEARLSVHERAYGNEKLVKLYTARAEPDSVLVYAGRALEAESTNTRYWGNVGTALYNLKRYPEAGHYFEEAARRGSDRPEVYYNLGQSFLHQDRPAEAIEPFRRAIDLGGERPNYLFALGLARVESGDAPGGRSIWEYILKRWPDNERTLSAYQYYFGARTATPHR